MANKQGNKVAYQEVNPTDMADPHLAKLNNLLLQITNSLNYALGYNGTVILLAGLQLDGDLNLNSNNIRNPNQILPVNVPKITGSKGGNAALASLITALAKLGLVVDETT